MSNASEHTEDSAAATSGAADAEFEGVSFSWDAEGTGNSRAEGKAVSEQLRISFQPDWRFADLLDYDMFFTDDTGLAYDIMFTDEMSSSRFEEQPDKRTIANEPDLEAEEAASGEWQPPPGSRWSDEGLAPEQHSDAPRDWRGDMMRPPPQLSKPSDALADLLRSVSMRRTNRLGL